MGSKATPISERLREARIKAGYEKASHAAVAMSINYQTYAAHENGGAGLTLDAAGRYARKFGVGIEWLATGKGSGPQPPTLVTKIIPPTEQGVTEALFDCIGVNFHTSTEDTKKIAAMLVVSAIRVLKVQTGAT